MAHMGSLDKVRQMVYMRCNAYCEKCGLPLPQDWALHHRKLKSRGGNDDASNLLALHHKCHNTGTDSVHLNPKMAKDKGYMVSSWAEPTECPVTLPDGRSVILTTEGKYQVIKEGNYGW